jgi:hypothetical protein
MIKTRLAPIAILLVAGSAFAAATWAESVQYKYASSTSLKITEPQGFAVSVETPDGTRTGTVPEVFTFENQDAYVTVRLTAPDGEMWKKKIELRTRQQAELAVSFKPAEKPVDKPVGKPEEAKPENVRTYIARGFNGGSGCQNKKFRAAIKLEFLRDRDGETAAAVVVEDGVKKDFDIAPGKYSVRVYRSTGQQWDFAFSSDVEAPAKDGAIFGYGCVNGASSPSLIVR